MHERQETAQTPKRRRAGRFLIWSRPVLFTLFLLFNFFQFLHNIRQRLFRCIFNGVRIFIFDLYPLVLKVIG